MKRDGAPARRIALVALAAAAAAALALVPGPGDARAGGFVLDGRPAPDLALHEGVGIGSGARLSSFRGQVVWLEFVLRDCPLCRDTLARAQDRHERWGGTGLTVLVVMHGLTPDAVRAWMGKEGFSFRVACDPTGEAARAYGVDRRPTGYLVGADGTVRASNTVPDAAIRTELARRRVSRLGPVPDALEPIRDLVWRWDYGGALRWARAHADVGAGPEVRRVLGRVEQDAGGELDARLAYVRRLARRGRREEAKRTLDRVVAHFAGTPLEGRARAARDALSKEEGTGGAVR